jgi:uncharacterized protein (TIGR02600 family)
VVHWEIPTYTAGIDLHFSRYKPIQDEFTRYPGHPATTSLVPVLWSFGGLTSPDETLQPLLNPPLNPSSSYLLNTGGFTLSEVQKADVRPQLSASAAEYWKKILSLNPRNMWGGSEMGTKPTVIGLKETLQAQNLDADRLFASVDEAFFGMPGANDPSRPANAFALRASDVEKLRFFLTTQSRAPETNPFNQPKVGMWPINEPKRNPANPDSVADPRTPTDKLMAFCSTLNGLPYYFTRNNPDSSTSDFQPGSRNDKVFDYLENSLSRAVPGFGGNLKARYGTETVRRFLTLAYDFIRSVNLTDTFDYTYISRNKTKAPYAFVPPRSEHVERGKGQVVPIKIQKGGTEYKGLGRFITIKQVALQFIAVAANQPPAMIDPGTGVPTATPNPMHPWVANPPAQINITNNGDGTWDLGAPNAYPTIAGQTHAGLPFRTDKWMSEAVVTGPTPGMTDDERAEAVKLRNSVINPRYHGPAVIYGAGEGTGATNSTLLPEPAPVATAGKLGPHQTLIQAALLIDGVLVNPGNPPYLGRYQVRVTGLDGLSADGRPLGFGADLSQYSNETVDPLQDYNLTFTGLTYWRRSSTDKNPRRLSLVSELVPVSGPAFAFGSGGPITIEIRTDPISGPSELIQSFEIQFPPATFPTPILPPMPVNKELFTSGTATSSSYRDTGIPAAAQDLTSSSMLTFDTASDLAKNPNFGVGGNLFSNGSSRGSYFINDPVFPQRASDPEDDHNAKLTADTIRSMELLYGDTRVSGLLSKVASSFFKPHKYYYDTEMRAAHSLRRSTGTNYLGATDHALSSATYTADHVPGQVNNYRGVPASTISKFRELGARRFTNNAAAAIRSRAPNITSSADLSDTEFAKVWANGGDYDTGPGMVLDGPYIGKATEGGQGSRFWADAPHFRDYDASNTNPDFNTGTVDMAFTNLQSGPSKQVASPVVFGSLPVGNTPQTSWRTLLFSPNPNSQTHLSLPEVSAAGAVPSANRAPDYLILDFFNMPVVEPYAISEPFSTAGRVNMNYQIAPFTYVRRDTALRGVLRSGLLAAAEDKWAENRKYSEGRAYTNSNPQPLSYLAHLRNTGHWAFRYPIHVDETLKQFEQRFANGDLFRAPSEITSLWLYPARQPTASQPENSAEALVNWDANSSNIKSWWYDNPGTTRKSVTADNMRERPYAAIYPRLTTKSNTFTTYFKVQVLQKSPQTRPDEWVEGRDQVRSEYRGSATIERYIDPSDPALPDFALAANADVSLDDFYRFRVMNAKRFAP